MRLRYLGHSSFLVETAGGTRLLIDPFLTGNPSTPPDVSADTVEADYILCSHAHDDHTSDVVPIARRTGATIIGNFELAEYYAADGLKTHGLNPGGGHTFPFGRVKLTIAHHTSSLGPVRAPVYLGVACGLLIEADGQRLYHAGDTGLFLDMQLIARGGLDCALLPIGDTYTMGPDDALDALDLLKPRVAVPMHYNTWPAIAQDADAWARAAAARGHLVQSLRPGASLSL